MMPEEERYEIPPERPPRPPEQPPGVPEPGSVPEGTPFAPEPGTETPYVTGPEETAEIGRAEVFDAEAATEGSARAFTGEPVAPDIGPTGATPAGPSPAETIPPPPPRDLTVPPSGPGGTTGVEAGVSDDDRLMAALAWVSMVILQVPLVSLVLLVAEWNKTRPFQRYHAIASIIFWVVAFVYELVAAFAFTVLTVISLGCLAICLWVIFFLPHIVALWYAFQAYQGRYSEIPFISDLMRKQRWV
jgi:hypothetical protein